MVEREFSKLDTRVRFPSPAPSKITSCKTSYTLLLQERNHLAQPLKEVFLRNIIALRKDKALRNNTLI